MKNTKELQCNKMDESLIINSDWFINPVSLEQYKKDYLQWILGTINVQKHTKSAIQNFSSTDACTMHALCELTGMSHPALRARLEKKEHSWLKIISGDKRTPLFSRLAVIAVVQEESALYQQTYSLAQVAIQLGYSVSSFRSVVIGNPCKFKSIYPEIEMPLSNKKRFFIEKVEALALKLNGEVLNKEQNTDRSLRRIKSSVIVKKLESLPFYNELKKHQKAHFNHFFKWCIERHLEVLPAKETTINAYFDWINKKQLSKIDARKAAVRDVHYALGFNFIRLAKRGELLPDNDDYMMVRSKLSVNDRSSLNLWVKWCINKNKVPFPATEEDVAVYLLDVQKEKGLHRATDMKSCISRSHDILCYPNPFRKMKMPIL